MNDEKKVTLTLTVTEVALLAHLVRLSDPQRVFAPMTLQTLEGELKKVREQELKDEETKKNGA